MNNDNSSKEFIPNILIVDDIPSNLKVLGEILDGAGYKVRPVPNGVVALKAAEKRIPDLILLDIMMPDIDGYEVCRRLKAHPSLRDVPIIFISALNETDDIVKALAIGGEDYITKPFRAEEVKARVATHLKLYRQRKELQELNATKDKFFSIIAHDLKSPFQGLLTLTQIMVEEAGSFSADELARFGTAMNHTAANLYMLLKNLLEWAQMQKGAFSFQPSAYALSEKVSESIKSLQERGRQKGIAITNLITGDFMVYADEKMINSVLMNLISNAVKYTCQNGSVTIKAEKTGGQTVTVSVHDTGVGMKSTLVERLFKIGEKVRTLGTAGEESTGLGLLLSKEFVEKNGGKIWVESEEGKGSTFYFTLQEWTEQQS